MTENRDLYHHDFFYYGAASSPFTSADPYQLMATHTDHYPPTMATTTTAFPDYFHGSSTSTSMDYNALATALTGGGYAPSTYCAPDVFDAGGKGSSSADIDALLMDSSAVSAGAGGGGDGSTTGDSRTPASPNSSVSSSSTEAAGIDEEDSSARRGATGKPAADQEAQDRPIDDGKAGDGKSPSSSKKQAGKAATAAGGGRKKGEKRQRQPRFAFMTKSEVDHLEDGYRWRKYGQKAVKNSPYPRSYYRCTTHKCTVKKRVERSHQDPSVVITTYEGQHTHPSPAALRGAAAGAALTHSHMLAAAAAAAAGSQPPPPMPGFRRDLLMLHHQQQMQQQRDAMITQAQEDALSNPMQLLQQQYHAPLPSDRHYHQHQQPEFAGHQDGHAAGLLQDMVLPSSSFLNGSLLQQSYNWSN